MSKVTWLGILIILLILGVIFFISTNKNSDSTNISDESHSNTVPSLENANEVDFSNIQTSDDDFNEIDKALDILE